MPKFGHRQVEMHVGGVARPATRRPGRARRCGRRRTRTAPPPCGPCVSPPICEMWMRMKSISRSLTSADPLVRVVEQLAHRDRRAGLRAELLEVADVLGAERVFEEEQLERLQVLGQLDRQDRRHALVHVVQQFHLVAELACGCARTAWARCGRRPAAPTPAAVALAPAVVVAFALAGGAVRRQPGTATCTRTCR